LFRPPHSLADVLSCRPNSKSSGAQVEDNARRHPADPCSRRFIRRPSTIRRFSGGLCRVRLEPADSAARLMNGRWCGSADELAAGAASVIGV
jgi:hypothetical protein